MTSGSMPTIARAIVVADDRPDRARALADAIEDARYGRARIAADAAAVTELGADADALVLRFDIGGDPIDILRTLSDPIGRGLPVLVVADANDRAGKRRALA